MFPGLLVFVLLQVSECMSVKKNLLAVQGGAPGAFFVLPAAPSVVNSNHRDGATLQTLIHGAPTMSAPISVTHCPEVAHWPARFGAQEIPTTAHPG
jgi:hypothetical protein